MLKGFINALNDIEHVFFHSVDVFAWVKIIRMGGDFVVERIDISEEVSSGKLAR